MKTNKTRKNNTRKIKQRGYIKKKANIIVATEC